MSRLRTALPVAAMVATAVTLSGCPSSQLIRVATSHDPRAAAEHLVQDKAQYYEYHPKEFLADFKNLVAKLRGHAKREWGKREAVTPSRKRYVKYTQNYKSRALVDFDQGTVTIETVDASHPQISLRTAIVSTLLTPEDPRSVDLYSDKPVRLSGTPYLYGLVVDRNGKPIGTPGAASAYADYLVRHIETRKVQTASGARIDHYVRIAMVPDHENVQADKYRPLVDRYAARYHVSESLVFAIIEVESNFNPYAVSSAGAFGLMQLVPSTAGTDAYQAVYGKPQAPSQDYLFDPANNIELGTAYLNVLTTRYLASIVNPVSLEYCTIAAYNAGAGTVFNQFSPHQNDAIARINADKPPSVYDALANGDGPLEMRQYLVKVLNARRGFVTETARN
ncbi:MAG TPA: murein transglycosylase domain-containing protein [Gammaproteobacteria bacterium]|nr:murein transglycosylase domain-containing protein [Gammaproteobacteria bacterium]